MGYISLKIRNTALVHTFVLHALAVAEALPFPTSALGALRAFHQLCDLHKLLNSAPCCLICHKQVIIIILQDHSEDRRKVTFRAVPLPGHSAWRTPSLRPHLHGPNVGHSETKAQVIFLVSGSLGVLALKECGVCPIPRGLLVLQNPYF